MQVYIAVCDGDNDYLIAKKRELNRWWSGALSNTDALVNQAGQWCFPGGKVDKNEKDLIEAAKREFSEETGYTLPAAVSASVVLQNKQYALVRYQIANLPVVAEEAYFNVQSSPSSQNMPQNLQVVDWELSEVIVIPKILLDARLGKKAALMLATGAQISQARPYSQEIDWYGEMAEHLMKN